MCGNAAVTSAMPSSVQVRTECTQHDYPNPIMIRSFALCQAWESLLLGACIPWAGNKASILPGLQNSA